MQKRLSPPSITNFIFSPIATHFRFIILIFFLIILVYANSLHVPFSIIDDYPGIVNNPNNQDLNASLQTYHFQTILHSTLINTFGNNPLPFRVFSITTHTINTLLIYAAFYKLFKPKITKIATLIFAIHPVATESVTWISGNHYLLNGTFFFLILNTYLFYKHTQQPKYLYYSLSLYTLLLLITRSPTVTPFPVALLIIDQFFIEPKLSWLSARKTLLILIPAALYAFLIFSGILTYRAPTLSENRIHLSQQTLTPVIEGYPYTLYSLFRLYIFPQHLSIYYEGQAITQTTRLLMYITSLIYILLLYFSWKKHRTLFGLLIILPVLIAYCFSPIPITWYIAERYLYLGIPFFAVIIGILTQKTAMLLPFKNKSLIIYTSLVLILIPLSIRTISRNQDYLDPKNFILQTIQTSPNSPRPYDDLGSLYYLEKDYPQAIHYYRQALAINSNLSASINNIGIIYLQTPPNQISKLSQINSPPLQPDMFTNLHQQALHHYANNEISDSTFYTIEALKIQSQHIQLNQLLGDLYLNAGQYQFANQQYLHTLKLKPDDPEITYKIAYTYFQLKNFTLARQYLLQTLELNPNHTNAKSNLKTIESLTDTN